MTKIELASLFVEKYLQQNGKTKSTIVKYAANKLEGHNEWNTVRGANLLNVNITNKGGPTYWELPNG